jgi:hypothetical protein
MKTCKTCDRWAPTRKDIGETNGVCCKLKIVTSDWERCGSYVERVCADEAVQTAQIQGKTD